jgi:hypothetical protein
MNELVVTDRYNLGLDEFIAWFQQESRPARASRQRP